MPLDKIPNIDWGVLETHYEDRYKSHEEFLRFKSQIEEHMNGNKTLDYIIKMLALQSEDPPSVYKVAYTILDVINAQHEVDELNQQQNFVYSSGGQNAN